MIMDCKECAENLTAYQDNELSSAETEEVHSHLRICQSCAEELSSLHKASEYIDSRIQILIPKPETWRLVQARIDATRVSSSRFHRFSLRWRLAAAALALFVISGIGYMQYKQFEKRSLESYLTKYSQEREIRMRAKSVFTNSEKGFRIKNPYDDNPFIEIKATPVDNPFLLEER
jgi:hypothetical protein